MAVATFASDNVYPLPPEPGLTPADVIARAEAIAPTLISRQAETEERTFYGLDTHEQFRKAGRTELVEKETREREILRKYLPAQKSPDEIRAAVREAIAGLPPEGRNQGALMKAVLPHFKGLADGNVVRQIVTEELAQA